MGSGWLPPLFREVTPGWYTTNESLMQRIAPQKLGMSVRRHTKVPVDECWLARKVLVAAA